MCVSLVTWSINILYFKFQWLDTCTCLLWKVINLAGCLQKGSFDFFPKFQFYIYINFIYVCCMFVCKFWDNCLTNELETIHTVIVLRVLIILESVEPYYNYKSMSVLEMCRVFQISECIIETKCKEIRMNGGYLGWTILCLFLLLNMSINRTSIDIRMRVLL